EGVTSTISHPPNIATSATNRDCVYFIDVSLSNQVRLPRSPVGFQMRTAIMNMKGSSTETSGRYTAPTACIIPSNSAAMKAPANEPSPPITTTTKESMSTSELMCGESERNGPAIT